MYLYLPLPQQSQNLAKSLKGNKYILPDGQQRDERGQSLRPPWPGCAAGGGLCSLCIKDVNKFSQFHLLLFENILIRHYYKWA